MKTHSLLLAAFLMLPALSSGQTISTGVPGFISYQGRVLDSTGALVGTGTPVNRTVIFRVWNHPTNTGAANLIYSEEQTVTIAEGEFSVLVGQGVATSSNQFLYSETSKGPPASIADAFNGSARYLGVTVDDGTVAVDNEITPRQQVVTSAFAFRSKYAETLGTSTSTALTVLDSGKIGLGNTNPPSLFTISGANTSLSTSTPQFVVTADDVSERLRVGVDSTGNGTSFLQSYKEGTGATNLLLNPNGGNVGIGTASPSTPLYVLTNSTAVAGDSGLTIEQAGTGDAALSLLITGQIRYNIGIDNSDGDKLKIFSDSLNAFGGSGITMDVSGRVGIGTTTPFAKFQAGAGFLWASPEFQAYGGYQQIGAALTLGSFVFHAGAQNESSLSFRAVNNGTQGWTGTSVGIVYDVDGFGPLGDLGGGIWMYNGKVGIGTTSPVAPLQVANTASLTFFLESYLNHAGATNDAVNTTQPVGLVVDSGVRAVQYFCISDERTKAVAGRSDSTRDLAILDQLEVTDYHFIDTVSKGKGPQKKVIAQQVEKVYPQAVTHTTGPVPDIYRPAEARGGWIELDTDLSVEDRVKVVADDRSGVFVVEEVRDGAFRLRDTSLEGKVFVYGRDVDDLRTVDYEALSMLNVSATQELARKVEKLEAESAEKDAALAAMTKRLAALEAEDKARNAKLAAIEKLLRGADKPAVRTASLKSAE